MFPPAHEGPDRLASGFRPRKAVQEIQLAGRLHEELVLVLAVDLHQLIAEARQEAEGGRRVAHESAAPAAPAPPAPDDELPVLRRVAQVLEDAGNLPAGIDVEDGLHGRRLGVRADQVGLRAGAQEQQDGVDEDGLAGARLAGQDIEAGSERDGDFFDHREALHSKLTEHSCSAYLLGPRLIAGPDDDAVGAEALRLELLPFDHEPVWPHAKASLLRGHPPLAGGSSLRAAGRPVPRATRGLPLGC